MPELTLRVNGNLFSGWTSARVTRGIETIANSFDVSVSDRWGIMDKPWLIVEEDAVELRLGDEVVITGYVDARSISVGAEEHSLSIRGRDKTGALVDCSAVPPSKSWEFYNTPLLKVAERVCKPFGITNLRIQPGVKLDRPPSHMSIDPGETPFEVIEKACRFAGVLPISDGKGGILFTQAGTERAISSLIEGENIKHISADFDASQRFYKYMVSGQRPGTDEDYGLTVSGIRATTTDDNVKRKERTLLIKAEMSCTPGYAKRRAEWERTVRAAKGGTIQVTVQDWVQGDNKTLWPINALVRLNSPSIGINSEMLITQATYSLGEEGTMTQLTLKRPDAFTPEPAVPRPDPWKVAD